MLYASLRVVNRNKSMESGSGMIAAGAGPRRQLCHPPPTDANHSVIILL